jgi:copper chaperone CopZ
MTTKTFEVPNIGCNGCVQAIKNELGDLAGIASVEGEVASRMVTVEYGDPASWEKIATTLEAIDYPPAP